MAAPAMPAPGTGWSITNQTPTVGKIGSAVTNGWDVSYVTGRGYEGKLFIPISQFTAEYVRQQIAAAALNLDTIGMMTG